MSGVHNLLQAHVKVTARDMALTVGKNDTC